MMALCAGAVFMAKKNWMRPGWFWAGAPMANFVEYLFFLLSYGAECGCSWLKRGLCKAFRVMGVPLCVESYFG